MSLQLSVLTGTMSSHLVPIISLLADGIMIVNPIICSVMIEHEEIVDRSLAASQNDSLAAAAESNWQFAAFLLTKTFNK